MLNQGGWSPISQKEDRPILFGQIWLTSVNHHFVSNAINTAKLSKWWPIVVGTDSIEVACHCSYELHR